MARLFLLFVVLLSHPLFAQENPVKVGTATLLSGEWAGLGENIINTIETYRRHELKHKIVFIAEDAKLSGADGLRAYQRLINQEHVDVIIGGTSSNGTMAGAPLINSSKTVMITPVTGGSNVDGAGEWIFRIGNSDVLNGTQQARLFLKEGLRRVALVSEETEYTQDISKHFSKAFKESAGQIVYSNNFAPSTTDFRTQITLLRSKKPQAIFFTTQTGSSLAVFMNQLDELGGYSGEVHTTFTAADNPEARALAKKGFRGIRYLAPAFNGKSERFSKFIKLYHADHGKDPLIPFHTAGTVDALDLLQAYLDSHKKFSEEDFRSYLLSIHDYDGLMGRYSFDTRGNANTGFVPSRVTSEG